MTEARTPVLFSYNFYAAGSFIPAFLMPQKMRDKSYFGGKNMKSITDILKSAGLEVSAEKLESFNKEFNENYKAVAELQKKSERVTEPESQLKTATDELKKFEGVKPEELNQKVADLTKKLKDAEDSYKTKLSDMEFDNALEGAITGAKGKNSKAIRALLDIDTLKASKERSSDIKAAIESVKKENAYLFNEDDTPGGYPSGSGSHGGGGENRALAAFARGAGIEEEKEK